jgi:hypothetical protein
MDRLILTILAVFIAQCITFGQKVTTRKGSQKVKNETAEGFQTDLTGKRDDVSAAWNKFLKETGKGKTDGLTLVISEPVVGGTVYAKGILYATTESSGENSKVWIGLIPGEWNAEDIESVNKELEQLVYRFGVKFYKDEIQKQIDESEAASLAVDRQSQRLVNESKSLAKQLTNNDEEKIQLEKAIEANKLEDLVLKQKIVNNKKAQDSVAQAGVQIRKMVELHKERQTKVN